MLKEQLNNMTPKERRAFAKAIGIDYRTVDYWKTGGRTPSRKTIPAIARFFRWDEKKLFVSLMGADDLNTYAHLQLYKENDSHCCFSSKVIEYFKDTEKYVALINAQVEADEFEMALNSMKMCAQHAENQFKMRQAVERPREKNPQQSDMDERVQGGEDTLNSGERA